MGANNYVRMFYKWWIDVDLGRSVGVSPDAEKLFNQIMGLSLRDSLLVCYLAFEYPGMDEKRINMLLYALEAKLKQRRLEFEQLNKEK